MSQSFVDQVTLDLLLNKQMYTNHVENKKKLQINKEERKLYKKRIFQLFKDIITGEEPDELPMDVKYTYNNFVNSCIHYLKTKDNHDIIQSEYKDFIFEESQDVSLNQINQINQINQLENNLEVDKLLVRSIAPPPAKKMDSDVIQSFLRCKKLDNK